MPKRGHKNEDRDYLTRKLRKIEKKLASFDNEAREQVCSERSNCTANVSPMPILLNHEDEWDMQPDVDIAPIILDEPQPGTSSSIAQTAVDLQAESLTETGVDQPALDEEILSLLGETPSKDKKYGADIRSELAVHWEHIATTGLLRDSKKELVERHLVPKNCTRIDAPKLNPEIKAALSEMLLKKDKALENKQVQIATSISCISEALTRLISLEHKDQIVIKLLIAACRLMCDTQHNESMTRRSFICSTIKKEIKDHLFTTEIDSFLFGEKLADTLKMAKAISKSGAEIKINTPVRKSNSAQKPKQSQAQALNQKPPLPTTRQAGAARRFEPMTMPRPRPPQPARQPPRSQHHPAPRR